MFGRRADRARRVVAVPVARALADLGLAGIAAGFATMLLTRPPDIVLADIGRFVAARAADGNYYVAPGAEKLTRSFLARDRGGAAALAEVGTGDGASWTARARGGASIPRAAAGSRWSRARPGCRSCATRSTRSSRRCRPGSPAARWSRPWTGSTTGARARSYCGSIPSGIIIESANASRGDRPWVPHPVSARERARRAQPEEAAPTRRSRRRRSRVRTNE